MDERQTVRSPRRRPSALRREDVGLESPQTVFGVNGWEDNIVSLPRHQVDAVCMRVRACVGVCVCVCGLRRTNKLHVANSSSYVLGNALRWTHISLL